MKNKLITRLKEFFKNIIHLKLRPWKIALSLALGVFVGLAFPIGLQTIIAIPLAILFECNILVTTTATLVSNPLTMIPLYYLNFKIGEFITRISISEKQITDLISSPTFESIGNIGSDALILFFTGSIIQGLIFGLLVYFISLKLILLYRSRKSPV